jgi:hypothetical protein
MTKFAYKSHQMHVSSMNGETKQQENIVNIKNGKGTKTVKLTENGKTRKTTKTLTEDNINCIRNHQFIPGLFSDCLRDANLRLAASNTRRRSKKKGTAKK